MLSRHQQQGLSPLGFLFVACVFAAALYSALNIVPHYMTFQTIKSLVNDTLVEQKVDDFSEADYIKSLQKKFTINGVRDLKLRDILSVMKMMVSWLRLTIK